MAWSTSGLYIDTFKRALGTTQLALDLDLDTHKIALYTNSLTPDYSASNPQYSSTNEVTGTGYTAGGATLTGTTLTAASGLITWDADNVQWTGSTLSGVYGATIYADALTDNNLVCGVYFGGTGYTTADGTLLVAWHANGIWRISGLPS